jgi:hypothetical protein
MLGHLEMHNIKFDKIRLDILGLLHTNGETWCGKQAHIYNTPKSFTIETSAYTMMFCPHQSLKLVFLVLHAAQRHVYQPQYNVVKLR